jgi:hypothetical protein
VPPLAAEQLQWASMVTHINTMTTGFGIGAIIMSSARMSGLAQNLKDVLTNRGKESADRLTKSIRNLDAQSFARLKSSKTPTSRTTRRRRSGARCSPRCVRSSADRCSRPRRSTRPSASRSNPTVVSAYWAVQVPLPFESVLQDRFSFMQQSPLQVHAPPA